MATMTAFRMIEWERPPEYQDIPVPDPGPGDVRVRMAGVGLCHTDIHFLHARVGAFPYDPPFTLGHENGGWVDDVGAGVTDLEAGHAGAGRARPEVLAVLQLPVGPRQHLHEPGQRPGLGPGRRARGVPRRTAAGARAAHHPRPADRRAAWPTRASRRTTRCGRSRRS